MKREEIERLVERQRKFFLSGKTRNIRFRKRALLRLERALTSHEEEIKEALKADLNKSSFEAYMTETGMVLSELRYLRKHMDSFAAAGRVRTPLAQFHSKSRRIPEPYGVTLVMSPWNYPFMLSLDPLAGSLAAGNCCILKPSAYAPAVSALLKKLLSEIFPPEYVAVVEGGREENTALLEQKFDYIFFTGSVAVGKLVMEKAAARLTPVTLELGGKSPCIVDRSAKVDLAAKRIVFGKFLNSGQTCVAPDYVLVDKQVEKEFLEAVKKWIGKMLGKEPLHNPDYPRMVNEKHFRRVLGLLEGEKIVTGGRSDPKSLRIEPTVLRDVKADSPVMREEIFGPVLPVLSFCDIKEAEQFVLERPRPLALYLFTEKKRTARRILRNLPFGGGCVNDTIIHLATSYMGFGGVGESGMGSYHGKESFVTFSHYKSVVLKSTRMDLPVRYMPYTKWKEKLLRIFLR